MICLLWFRLRRLLLRGEVHVDFSGSNIDDGFDSVEERSSKDGGWIILVFSHVNDLKSGAECMLLVGAWFHAGADK